MPRSGQNPMKWTTRLASPAPVTLTTMVYLPELSGFWSESFEVLQLCLDSLRRTSGGAELLVLDNGSCAEVRDCLFERQRQGDIDQLILSGRNLGKMGGWNLLFAAAQGEYVAYSDCDVFFLPGWLETSLQVLRSFPEAAMVTAQPIPGDLSLHCDSTLSGAAAAADVEVEEGGDLIPEHHVESHRRSLGEAPEEYGARLRRRRDVKLQRGASKAFVSASHFQFVARRSALEAVFPLEARAAMGDVGRFDEAVDESGAWRLSTVDYLVHHMGNRLPNLAEELPWAESLGDSESVRRAAPAELDRERPTLGWAGRVARIHRVRQWVKWLHRRTYELLHPS